MSSRGQLRITTISGEEVFSTRTSGGQYVYTVSSTQVANGLVLGAFQLPDNMKILIRFSKFVDSNIAAEIRDIVSRHPARMEILEGLDLLERVDIPKEDIPTKEATGRPWSPSLKWIAIPTVALILLAATIWKAESPLIGSLFTIEKVEVQKIVENLEVQKAFSYH